MEIPATLIVDITDYSILFFLNHTNWSVLLNRTIFILPISFFIPCDAA